MDELPLATDCLPLPELLDPFESAPVDTLSADLVSTPDFFSEDSDFSEDPDSAPSPPLEPLRLSVR